MAGPDYKSNRLFQQLVANSLFTPRQVSIISNMLQGGTKPVDISSGAYYRQVGQCRDKAVAVLYSAVLLQSTGVLQSEALGALGRLADQLGVIFSSAGSDVLDEARTESVMSVMDQLVKRVCKL
jgi:hypothetical protein